MRRFIVEISLIFILTVLAVGIVYEHLTVRVNTIGKEYRFEQEWLVSAISVACGQGFTTPTAPYPENMQLFLEQKTDSMRISDLPEDWSRWDNSPFVKTHRYLIITIGALWRLFGIHWDVLKLYAGILFVITVLSTYITLYMLAGRIPAFIATFLVINAPSLLFLLPSIRDYSKTTFFMLFLALSATLFHFLSKGVSLAVIISSLLGLVIGFGIGFRQDVLILFLPGMFFVSIVCFKLFYQGNKFAGIMCLLFYLFSFFAVGYPILSAVAEDKGAVSSHSLVQGLATTVEKTSLGGSSSYRLVYEPNDMLVHSTIVSFARRMGFQEPFNNYLSPAYGKVGRMYFRSVVKHFPADLWGRFLSVCSNCFSTPYHFTKEQQRNRPEFSRFASLLFFADRLPFWDMLIAFIGPWVVLGLILIMGMQKMGKGILFAGILGYLLGYPSILFEFRHVVHLVPILYGVVVLFFYELFVECYRFLLGLYQKEQTWGGVLIRLRNGAFVLIFVVCACVLLYSILNIWQRQQVAKLVVSYRGLKWEEVKTKQSVDGACILFQPAQNLPAFEKSSDWPPMETPFEFLRADFELEEIIPIYSRYDRTYCAVDFSEPLHSLLLYYNMTKDKPLRVSVYFLVYSASTIKPRDEIVFNNQEPIVWVRGEWKGVEIPKGFEKAFRGLYRAENPSAEPFLMTVAVPEEDTFKGNYKHWRFAWNFMNVYKNLEHYKKYEIYK